jgi:ABC-type phosphate transport system substrate-binding protein
MRTRIVAVVALLGLAVLPSFAAPTPSYRIIVNGANQMEAIRADELARLFLKTVRRWNGGTPVQPVDQTLTSAVRQGFTRDILGQSTGQLQEYWLKQTFSGRDVPPPVRGTDAAVVEYVRGAEGAIGYVSSEAALPAGVKAIAVVR